MRLANGSPARVQRRSPLQAGNSSDVMAVRQEMSGCDAWMRLSLLPRLVATLFAAWEITSSKDRAQSKTSVDIVPSARKRLPGSSSSPS